MRASVRSSLLRKYMRVLLALVGGTLMVSGLAELYFSYRQAQQAIIDVEQAHATAAASRIEQFLSEVQEQVRDTTRTASDDPSAGPLGPAALGFREGLDASIAEQRELDFLRVLRRVPAISDLRHLDVSGREQLHVSRLHPDVIAGGRDFSHAPEFLAARVGKIYWGPVRLHDDAEPYLIMAMPVGTYAVEVTSAEVGLRTLQRIVSRLSVGTGGYAYVVDAADQLVAHPDARTLRERRDLAHLAQVKSARARQAGEPDAAQRRLGSAGDHEVGVAQHDHARGVADGMRPGRAGRDHTVVGALQAEADRYLPAAQVDQAGRDEEGTDPATAALLEHHRRVGDGGEPADA